jgi:hypothetical protein
MELSINSKTTKLYKWFYSTYALPMSLCPYFWKLVIMYIFLLPYVLLSLPYIIVNKIFNDGDHDSKDNIVTKPILGVVLYFCLGILLSMLFSISIFWLKYPKDSFLYIIQKFGITTLVTCIIVYIMYLLVKCYIVLQSKKRYKNNSNKKYILTEYIKASYNKYCPKIDWK